MAFAGRPDCYNRFNVDHRETQRKDASSTSRPDAALRQNEEPMLWCPVCSTRLTARKCKLLCEKCGYYMSCADYY